jgi:cytoskeletal protein CcmA (bactofilin family)
MSIWKDLANPKSFAGEYETAVEAASPADRIEPAINASARTDKQQSIIGAGVVIEGKVGGDGDIRIAGSIKGDIQVKGNLLVEAGGRIVGAVGADRIAVGGEVDGNVTAANHIKLLETGQLIGDVKAKYLTVAAGARMRGKVEFGWDEPETKRIESKPPSARSENRPVA